MALAIDIKLSNNINVLIHSSYSVSVMLKPIEIAYIAHVASSIIREYIFFKFNNDNDLHCYSERQNSSQFSVT